MREDAHKYILREWIAAVRRTTAGYGGMPSPRLAAEARFTGFYADVAPQSHSQLGQDAFALLLAERRHGGTFVEVGAGNGRDHSNTLMLERHFAWDGILIDRDPAAAGFARSIRSARVIEAEVTSPVPGRPGISLQEILDAADVPDEIDYLSIDTDGSELDVLAGLDLGSRRIVTISVMHNFDTAKIAALDAALGMHGYVRVLENASDADAYYVLRSRWRDWLGEPPDSRVRPVSAVAPGVSEDRPPTVTPMRDGGTVIYMAAGVGSRWGGYGGGPKQTVKLHPEGQTIIGRLVDQFSTRLPGWRHVLVADDPRVIAAAEGAFPEVASPLPGALNCDKFLSAKPFWNDASATLFVYGDCFLARATAGAIAEARPSATTFFGSKAFGELFAVYVPPRGLDAFEARCLEVRAAEAAEATAGGGWRILRHASGLSFEPSDGDVVGPIDERHYRDLHDGLSRDFDYPSDLDGWRTALSWVALKAMNEVT